jgi:hypothetical protein
MTSREAVRTSVTLSSGRRNPRWDAAPGDTGTALAPVARALLAAAEARARAEHAAADEDVRAELGRAHADAERLLAEAREEGRRAGGHVAAALLVVARREARSTVLAARRRAYETLEHSAVEALVERAGTDEGRQLAQRMEELVRDRIGGSAPRPSAGTGGLVTVAELGNRRASLGPSDLVDLALASMADQIETLWT